MVERDSLTIRNEGLLQYIESNPSLDIKQLLKLCLDDELENGVNISSDSTLKDSLEKLESYGFIKKVKNKKNIFLYYPKDFEITENNLKVKKVKKVKDNSLSNEEGNEENTKKGRPKSELPTKESIAKDWISKQSNEYLQVSSCSKGYRDYGKHNCVFPTFHKVWNQIKKEREL